MKKALPLAMALAALCACQKPEDLGSEFYSCEMGFADSSSIHPQHARYQAALDDIVQRGVVGINLAVYTPSDGMWLGASGMADLHNGIEMQPCHLSRMGSTVKMFTAATVLKLQEAGKLDLDAPLAEYLQGPHIDKIAQAERATIRQLLQHSSGIYNYIQNLKFQTASINELLKAWEADDLLKYAHRQKAYFEPGEDVAYSNTNYILLGLLIEKLEGKPLYQVFEEQLFIPAGLASTQFAGKNPVPDGIVRGYIDLYSNLQVTESTYYSGWDYYTADGGLISTPYDLNVFFRKLMGGELISPASLSEMLSWQEPLSQPTDFFPMAYGLGIFRAETPYGTAYFHSGDAIGYYANMMYFPADSTTLVYAVNSNYGKIDQYVSTQSAMEGILDVFVE